MLCLFIEVYKVLVIVSKEELDDWSIRNEDGLGGLIVFN